MSLGVPSIRFSLNWERASRNFSGIHYPRLKALTFRNRRSEPLPPMSQITVSKKRP
jgi:hypothetical protein